MENERKFLSKCLNFRRTFDGKNETQICKPIKTTVTCGSWSDGCTNRYLFKSAEHLPLSSIEFNKLKRLEQ